MLSKSKDKTKACPPARLGWWASVCVVCGVYVYYRGLLISGLDWQYARVIFGGLCDGHHDHVLTLQALKKIIRRNGSRVCARLWCSC